MKIKDKYKYGDENINKDKESVESESSETDEESETSELEIKQKREIIINTTHKMHKEIIPTMYINNPEKARMALVGHTVNNDDEEIEIDFEPPFKRIDII